MIDYNAFLTSPKSMLIAPAGYGKTTTIAECLERLDGRQLILTHTHAGVASNKEKLREKNIPASKYNVETISGYAQKYVFAFDTSGDMPSQDDRNHFFPYVVDKATHFFEVDRIIEVVTNTYDGVFVDEYQDCTVEQHQMISRLAEHLPTRIFGDPMQGIFGFGGQVPINMEDENAMGEFGQNFFELVTPQRWRNGGNPMLGDALDEIRGLLGNGHEVNLNDYEVIQYIQTGDYENDIDLYRNDASFRQGILDLENERSLLVVYPEPRRRVMPRAQFVEEYGDNFALVEAIDGPEFYYYARRFDAADESNVAHLLEQFTRDTLVNFAGWGPANEQETSSKNEVNEMIEGLQEVISFSQASKILVKIRELPRVRCLRTELFDSLSFALEKAANENISVIEAMIDLRNSLRRNGRRLNGRCIGTTLLTKGLEFDTVVLINAHRYNCPKNLYVAMTRPSQRLIVFSTTNILSPY